jgi:bifunctional non-homologous end joining protein LigD
MGAVELHAWNSTVDDLEHPDVLVLDLDPGPGLDWEFVVETALQLREVLDGEGLLCWPKLTGGKGVHLMVPIGERRMSHDEAHRYSRMLAERMVKTAPHRYTTQASIAAREGRLFLDYLRNGRGTTAVATYSPRARPGFPIAAPTTWKALELGIRPDAFTMAQPFPRSGRGRASVTRNPAGGAEGSGLNPHERSPRRVRRPRQPTH